MGKLQNKNGKLQNTNRKLYNTNEYLYNTKGKLQNLATFDMPYFSNKFSLDCNDNIVLLTFIGKGENKNCFNPVYVLNLNLPCVPKSKTYCPKS